MRVAIVTPLLAMRLGLREMLGSLPGVEVSADAARPGALPPVDALVLTTTQSLPDDPLPVLLLTDDPDEAARLASWPVWGMLPLDASPDELAAALGALAEGLWVGSPGLVTGLFSRRPAVTAGDDTPIESLTAREREVLQLAAEGLPNKQIAAALNISDHTVKFHLSSLYAKLGVTSRTEAIRAGARRGWVSL